MIKPQIEATAAFGAHVDFGRAASDYRTFRAGFPDAFFELLVADFGIRAESAALDVGTGTGSIARGLAKRGLKVTGIDPSAELMREASELDQADGVLIDYLVGKAEDLPFSDQTFDLVTAGQCWHWFDRSRAAEEASRVLKPAGLLVIAHFDWLPLPNSVVAATERMILKANPAWTLAGGTGLYPQWLTNMSEAGFVNLTTRSFDMVQLYSHEAWRGRMRASAGIKASLDEEATTRFDQQLCAMLSRDFPEDPLCIPHRVWWAAGQRPL